MRHAIFTIITPLIALLEVWGYGKDDGPERWADLDPAFSMARDGRRQSPIDIRPPVDVASSPVTFSYGTGSVVVHRERLMLSFDVVGEASVETPAEVRRLISFHFHSPGEHTIGGEPADIEMHLLHSGDDERLTVVAVLIDGGGVDGAGEGSFVGDLLLRTASPDVDGATIRDVDLGELLPGDPEAQWRYEGSRTFPPCTEDVDWVVLQNRLTVSHAQLAALRSTYLGNVRPTQPLNGRRVSTTR